MIKDYLTIEKVVRSLNHSKHVNLKGIIAHNGLVYTANSMKEVIETNKAFIEKIVCLKAYFSEKGFPIIATVKDIPSVSICNDFARIDEFSPGNFVFYNVMQLKIGSCGIGDKAVRAFFQLFLLIIKRIKLFVMVGQHLYLMTLLKWMVQEFIV